MNQYQIKISKTTMGINFHLAGKDGKLFVNIDVSIYLLRNIDELKNHRSQEFMYLEKHRCFLKNQTYLL
jgi:hypothetical protein